MHLPEQNQKLKEIGGKQTMYITMGVQCQTVSSPMSGKLVCLHSTFIISFAIPSSSHSQNVPPHRNGKNDISLKVGGFESQLIEAHIPQGDIEVQPGVTYIKSGEKSYKPFQNRYQMSKTEYSMKLGNGWVRNKADPIETGNKAAKTELNPIIAKRSSEKLMLDGQVSSGKIMRSVNYNLSDLLVSDYTDAIKCSVSPLQLLGKKMNKYKI